MGKDSGQKAAKIQEYCGTTALMSNPMFRQMLSHQSPAVKNILTAANCIFCGA